MNEKIPKIKKQTDKFEKIEKDESEEIKQKSQEILENIIDVLCELIDIDNPEEFKIMEKAEKIANDIQDTENIREQKELSHELNNINIFLNIIKSSLNNLNCSIDNLPSNTFKKDFQDEKLRILTQTGEGSFENFIKINKALKDLKSKVQTILNKKINNNNKEIDIKETSEYKKMEQIDSEIFFLSGKLTKDKREEYRNRAYYIVREEIVAENPEELKKRIEDKIIRLEEIKKEIEDEIGTENGFNEIKEEVEIMSDQKKAELDKAFDKLDSDKSGIEQEKPAKQIIDNDIRTMLNSAKIRIEYSNDQGEMEKKLEQAVFAQSDGVRENQELMERVDGILEQISKESKSKADETMMLGLAKRVSEITGIEKEKIIQIIKNQENRIKEKAEQELYSGSFKKKLAIAGVRWGAYVGAGVGIGVLTVATSGTAGVFGGSALAGVRMAEGAITAKISSGKLKKIESELKKQLKKNQTEKDKFLTDIIAEIALNKQEGIDHRGEEKQEAENNLEEKREDYLKKGEKITDEEKKETDEYQKYSEAVNCLKENYKKSLSDYLDERYPDIDPNEKEQTIEAIMALFQNEENTELLKQEFFKKGLFKKGIDKIQKVLDNKWLGGKDTVEKKLRMAAVFAGAGFLARQSNTVKRILFTFAGAKAGSAIADLVTKNIKEYNVLNKVKAEDLIGQKEISDDLFNRAKTQLMDDNFKKENSSEYAKLREEVERIEKEKISEAERAEQSINVMEENYEKLRNKILEKKHFEKEVKLGKAGMQILGAGAGFMFGELFVHSAQEKANIEIDKVSGDFDKFIKEYRTKDLWPILKDFDQDQRNMLENQINNKIRFDIQHKGEASIDEIKQYAENLASAIKEEESAPEKQPTPAVDEFLAERIEVRQKLQNSLNAFCKEYVIDIDNGEKLTDEQGAKFIEYNKRYGIDNIKPVLKDHVEDLNKTIGIYLAEKPATPRYYDIGTSDEGTETTETYQPKITAYDLEENPKAYLSEDKKEILDKTTTVDVSEKDRGLKNSFTLKLGQDKIPAQLERVFHMMSVNSMKDIMGSDEIFGEEEGAKSLNIAANLVKLAEGENILGINANEFKKAVEWNVDTKELQIKNHAKFNEIVGELNAHAQKLWNNEILQKEAVAFLDDIEKNTWEDIIKANGLEEQVDGHDEITLDKIMDFNKSEIVENAEKFIDESKEAIAEARQHVAKTGATGAEDSEDKLEDFRKLDILKQKERINDLENKNSELVDKIAEAKEDAKNSLRGKKDEINALKTDLIKIFNEQHQTEIKEYKNLSNEINWMEKEKFIQAEDNLLVTGKKLYIKSLLSRYFGIFWDEEKWEKAKALNMSEVLNKKYSDIANKKLLSHLSEVKNSFGNPLEKETVGKYLERFEIEEAKKRLELDDRKEELEKLGKTIGYKK